MFSWYLSDNRDAVIDWSIQFSTFLILLEYNTNGKTELFFNDLLLASCTADLILPNYSSSKLSARRANIWELLNASTVKSLNDLAEAFNYILRLFRA